MFNGFSFLSLGLASLRIVFHALKKRILGELMFYSINSRQHVLDALKPSSLYANTAQLYARVVHATSCYTWRSFMSCICFVGVFIVHGSQNERMKGPQRDRMFWHLNYWYVQIYRQRPIRSKNRSCKKSLSCKKMSRNIVCTPRYSTEQEEDGHGRTRTRTTTTCSLRHRFRLSGRCEPAEQYGRTPSHHPVHGQMTGPSPTPSLCTARAS